MVEMEMRVDDQIDPCRVAPERRQPRADLLARLVVELEQAAQTRPEPRRRIVLAIRVHTGVEQRNPLGVLDQIGRDRQPDAALAALHQMPELTGQMPAGQSKNLQTHAAFASSNNRMFFSTS